LRNLSRFGRIGAAMLACAVALPHAPCVASPGERYDLVLRGGRVIDPESRLDATRDIGVLGGKIAAISEAPLRGKRVIDAGGLVVAPGFIDMHAHGQQLPAARMQAFDGVTTGLDLESGVMPVGQFYDEVAREGRPINYGATASWTATRYTVFNSPPSTPGPLHLNEIFGSDNWVRTLASRAQGEKILSMLEQGLREGALGIGVLLAYAPGSGNKEYYAVNKLAARHGVGSFTHVRSFSAVEPDSSFEAYQEVISTAAATGAHMHICHLNSTSGRDIELAVEAISAAQRRGVPLSVEAYPYPAAATMIGSAFFRGPNWQERLGGVRYEDFEFKGTPFDEPGFLRMQKEKPETIVVYRYLRPDRDARDQDYLDMSVLYPGGAIASDGGWWVVAGKTIEGDVWPIPETAAAHPRSAGTFSRLLRVYVRERGKLTLMQAIEKMSLIPARILQRSVPQMKHKGRIKEGADADLIAFDPTTVADRATFEKPAQASVGMRYVIVNGMPVIADGKLVRGALPGRPVRRVSP
jgi:N-acyl-D-glutamate deacylase